MSYKWSVVLLGPTTSSEFGADAHSLHAQSSPSTFHSCLLREPRGGRNPELIRPWLRLSVGDCLADLVQTANGGPLGRTPSISYLQLFLNHPTSPPNIKDRSFGSPIWKPLSRSPDRHPLDSPLPPLETGQIP